jgi:hypothetical protein
MTPSSRIQHPAWTGAASGSSEAAWPHHDPGLADSPDGFMTGGTLAQWFDVLVHHQEVSPAHPV